MKKSIILLLATLMLSVSGYLRAQSTGTPNSSNTLKIGITVNSNGTVSLSQSTGGPFSTTSGVQPYDAVFEDTISMDLEFIQFQLVANSSRFRCYFRTDVFEAMTGALHSEIYLQDTTDSNVSKRYDVVLTKLSKEATLDAIIPSSGTLVPEFEPNTLFYALKVGYSTDALSFNAVPTYGASTVGVIRRPPSLAVGLNNIDINVTSQDGIATNYRTYNIAVLRQSNDTTLKSLTLNDGDIPLKFDSATFSYEVTVPFSINSITVDAETSYESAEITAGTGKYQLSVGNNTLSVAVTAEDTVTGFTGTYSVTVRRKSDDATLNSLTLNGGNIPLEFDSATFSYEVTVPYSIDSITVDAEPSYESAEITAGRGKYPLSVGDTLITLTVTAEDTVFTKKTYTLAVRRMSNDATLDSLTLNPGDIQFGFHPNTLSYTVFVPSSVESITIGATAHHSSANVTAGTGEHSLILGDNPFQIKVTAEDTVFIKTYTVTVKRSSSDATLKSLTLNNGAIPFRFHPNIPDYRVEVEDEVSDIVIACEANHPEATVSGAGPHHLDYGDNVFPVTVTAEDRIANEETTPYVYTITVHRISNDATLHHLAISPAELIPPFDPDITQYTASVPYEVPSVMMDFELTNSYAELWTADELEQPGIKHLNVGENVFGIGVFSETKEYYRAYWVRITREAARTGFHEAGEPAAVHVYTVNGWLHVDSPAAERINIYSVTGTLLYGFDKPAGASTSPFTVYPSPVLIVKGSSGWTGKLVVND
ncbi:MAG: cadherin-like beta sandwich domain-containing protein [Dysgonamonadaceae bacterium]|jgi:hypothetical protein|nr:cadherin-like beta sandwich domain-containing protein [Dysgonamonadaceae bacterium]